MERHGSDYGGWMIPRGRLDQQSIIYAGGVGEDATFDESLIDTYGCWIFAFDPTPRSIAFAETIRRPEFHFFPYGLWSEDSIQQFRAPANEAHVSHSIGALDDRGGFTAKCRSVKSLLGEFGHDHIDLLKLDIEGAEYEVLPVMLADGIKPSVLCVELHGGLRRALGLIRIARRAAYVPVAVEGWDVTLVRTR